MARHLLKIDLRLVLLSCVLSTVCQAQDATATATAASASPSILAPGCAQSCVQSSQQVQTECSSTDQACLCQHSSSIQAAISSCLTETKACSESDQQVAIAYYPQFCASFGLSSDASAATTGANGLITAAGVAPTQATGTGASRLVLTSTTEGAATTQTVISSDSTNGSGTGLTVPAILGITLGIFLIAVGIAAFAVYHHVRRRQLKRRTRLEFLTTEFGDQFSEMDPPTVQRPPRSQSMSSHFVVQPTPPEKPSNDFDFGLDISRTSTLVSVAPPPPAKLNTDKDLPDIRASAYHAQKSGTNVDTTVTSEQRNSSIKNQRTSTLREFLGNSGDRLRASFTGGRSSAAGTRRARSKTVSRKAEHDPEKAEFDESNKI